MVHIKIVCYLSPEVIVFVKATFCKKYLLALCMLSGPCMLLCLCIACYYCCEQVFYVGVSNVVAGGMCSDILVFVCGCTDVVV